MQGINLITLLWHDGERFLVCDYRLYDQVNDSSKDDHFCHMVQVVYEHGFASERVIFDGWYSGLDNLKQVRERG